MHRFFIIVFLLVVSISCPAADDAYLKMLNGEAEELQLDQSGQLKQEEEKKPVRKGPLFGGELHHEEIPGGLTKDEFEYVLQQNFYGTYIFYNKLDSSDKQTTYYRYSKADDPDPEQVRQSIMDFLRR